MKYYVCLESDYNPNGYSVGEYLTLEEAKLGIWQDWAGYCTNDQKRYSKSCYYYEIQTVEENEDGEIEIIDIIDRIDVDDVTYEITE